MAREEGRHVEWDPIGVPIGQQPRKGEEANVKERRKVMHTGGIGVRWGMSTGAPRDEEARRNASKANCGTSLSQSLLHPLIRCTPPLTVFPLDVAVLVVCDPPLNEQLR